MSDDLPDAAQSAWRAYTGMHQSKMAHFNYLQALEDKYTNGTPPTLAENLRLRELLEAHDARVKEFRTLTQQLKTSDLSAYQALIDKLTLTNTKNGHA